MGSQGFVHVLNAAAGTLLKADRMGQVTVYALCFLRHLLDFCGLCTLAMGNRWSFSPSSIRQNGSSSSPKTDALSLTDV